MDCGPSSGSWMVSIFATAKRAQVSQRRYVLQWYRSDPVLDCDGLELPRVKRSPIPYILWLPIKYERRHVNVMETNHSMNLVRRQVSSVCHLMNVIGVGHFLGDLCHYIFCDNFIFSSTFPPITDKCHMIQIISLQ